MILAGSNNNDNLADTPSVQSLHQLDLKLINNDHFPPFESGDTTSEYLWSPEKIGDTKETNNKKQTNQKKTREKQNQWQRETMQTRLCGTRHQQWRLSPSGMQRYALPG